MKRFYGRAEAAAAGNGHHVLLDGRPLRTPAGRPLRLPGGGLAAAVAGEWAAQGERIDPLAMPLTRLATTVVDLLPAGRPAVVAELSGFAGSDLLCYRVAHPRELVARQEREWQPWLDWAARKFAARLRVTAALDPVPQPEGAVRALTGAVEALDDWHLVGLHAATTVTGSLILGLALVHRELDAERAFRLAHLEEHWEIERWGRDPEQEARLATLRRDLATAARFLELLDGQRDLPPR